MSVIEELFKIVNKTKNSLEEEIYFEKSINTDLSLINQHSDDVFLYGDIHLLELALKNDNRKIVDILLKYEQHINFSDLDSLEENLPYYSGTLEIFKQLDSHINADRQERSRGSFNPYYDKIYSFNKNKKILDFTLSRFNINIHFIFSEDNTENYFHILDFYKKQKFYASIMKVTDNSIIYYADKSNYSFANIKNIILKKIEIFEFLNEENTYNNDTVVMSNFFTEIFLLNHFLKDDVELAQDFINKNIKTYSGYLINYIFNKKIVNYLNEEELIFISKYLNENKSEEYCNIYNIEKHYNNDKYFIFFEHYKLQLEGYRFFYYILTKNKQKNIENLLKLIKIHNIKKVQNKEHYNFFINKVVNFFDLEYKEPKLFHILKPILSLLNYSKIETQETTGLNNKKNTYSHFIIHNRKTPYGKLLEKFYHITNSEKFSIFFEHYKKEKDYDFFRKLCEDFFKELTLKELSSIIIIIKEKLTEKLFSSSDIDVNLILIDLNNLKTNFELKKKINNDSIITHKKRL